MNYERQRHDVQFFGGKQPPAPLWEYKGLIFNTEIGTIFKQRDLDLGRSLNTAPTISHRGPFGSCPVLSCTHYWAQLKKKSNHKWVQKSSLFFTCCGSKQVIKLHVYFILFCLFIFLNLELILTFVYCTEGFISNTKNDLYTCLGNLNLTFSIQLDY